MNLMKTTWTDGSDDLAGKSLYACVRAPHGALPESLSDPSGPHAKGYVTMHSTILALDLGTTTGWALRLGDASLNHGFVHFKPQRFEGGGMRYLRFKRWLGEIRLLAGEINGIYFEEVRRHLGVDAAQVYGGLLATLTSWCEHHRIAYRGVPVGTIKRHATGMGRASKASVMEAMRIAGHPVTDSNEADALALLHWAIDEGDI